jgi:hypothetical protein
MTIVQRGNSQFKVNDADLETYLADGFSQIDEKGKVVKESTGKKSYTVQEVKALNAKIAKLEAENAKLKAKKE